MIINFKTLPFTDGNGKPVQPLLKLLKLTGISHDGSWSSILRATQASWYHPGKIRADIKPYHYERQRDELLPLFQALGLINEVHAPAGSRFKYALLLGATAKAMYRRIALLSKEMGHGVKFKNVVLFGSERPVSPKEFREFLEYIQDYPDPCFYPVGEIGPGPITEIRAIRLIYEFMATINTLNRNFVSIGVPLIGGRNPNTAETIKAWLGVEQPSAGSCLVVSSQPFVIFQGLVAEKTLPDGFSVTAIGYEAPGDMSVAKYLDNIAKLIFEVADSLGVRK